MIRRTAHRSVAERGWAPGRLKEEAALSFGGLAVAGRSVAADLGALSAASVGWASAREMTPDSPTVARKVRCPVNGPRARRSLAACEGNEFVALVRAFLGLFEHRADAADIQLVVDSPWLERGHLLREHRVRSE